ncbi:MAG TPA: hypothetical protein VN605_04635 [Thermoanaerobaculia bacterium]|nr:hypothetical protein [Thermoanaerobaculia bacterium]
MTEASDTVLQALSGAGLLLLQDKQLSNIATLVTGESLRSSWWSHPKGRAIFAVVSELANHPDVLFTRLIHGKVTLVHRRLWPAFLAVASSGEEWQLRGISAAASALLAAANESPIPITSSGKAVKEVAARLLAHTEEVHGELGKHEIVVQPWKVWARRAKVKPLRSTAAAKQQIEAAAKAIGADVTALPWHA